MAKAVVIAVGASILVTAFGWFLMGTASPFNHGRAPSVQDRPGLIFWVVANFPAAILFVSLFGKQGSETLYFVCVFLQWLVIAIPCALLGPIIRRGCKQ